MHLFMALATSVLALSPATVGAMSIHGSSKGDSHLHRRVGNAQCGPAPSSALPAADVAAAFASLEKNYCASNTTGWPIKPNQRGTGHSGSVMAYLCNPDGAAVQYCRRQDLASARAAIARQCGRDQPGFVWDGGMIGFMDMESDAPYCQGQD